MQYVPSIAMVETYVRLLLAAPQNLFRHHLNVRTTILIWLVLVWVEATKGPALQKLKLPALKFLLSLKFAVIRLEVFI